MGTIVFQVGHIMRGAFEAHIVQFTLVALSSVFFLVDPFAIIPTFLVMTARHDPITRRRMAARACWTAFIVLTAFAFAGTAIFKIFGITLPAFEIAGGLILLLIGLDMMQAERPTQEGSPETAEGSVKDDVSITPLGIPMLAGPGAISTVMVLNGTARDWSTTIPVFAAIALTCFASYWILRGAERVSQKMGQTGIRVLMRIMGLLLMAIAIQFMINGLTNLGVIHAD
ncbi:MarC family protein [Candidatus Korobacter versatilis]|nr:MarC family protein [Candidatus Koribacter versatilis]